MSFKKSADNYLDTMARRKKLTATELREMEKKAYYKLVAMSPRKVAEMCTEIMELYEEGNHTIEDCVRTFGCTPIVFNRWVRPDLVVEELILMNKDIPPLCHPDMNKKWHEVKDIAAANYSEALKQSARQGLRKKVAGFESVEITEQWIVDVRMTITDEDGVEIPNKNFGKMMVAGKRVKRKVEAPDTSAIIFALTNVDKSNFKNRNHITSGGEVLESDLNNLSDEELDNKINELENKKLD